jgi:hypothetical protein
LTHEAQKAREINKADPIATAIGTLVKAGELAGAATLIWRAGKVVETTCVGWRDVEAGLAIERDTLFRIRLPLRRH